MRVRNGALWMTLLALVPLLALQVMFAAGLGIVERVEILPFHQLGNGALDVNGTFAVNLLCAQNRAYAEPAPSVTLIKTR